MMTGQPTGEISQYHQSSHPLLEHTIMIEQLASVSPKVLGFKMSGKLHDEDYQKFVPVIEAAVAAHGNIRLLAQFENFHGWDLPALWDDIKFSTKHCTDIERIALVGEKTWEKWMAAVCKPFTMAKIQYFDSAKLAAAWTWLTKDDATLAMKTLKTILYATDFSRLANQAFHTAHALARDHGAQLILLYVKQPQETIEGEFGMPPPEPEPSDEAMFAQLRSLLPEGSPVQAKAMLAFGVAAEEIVRVAKEVHADLIVMGTHGRKGLIARLFHANVADHVTRDAPCPVMALRSSETET
jgi:nucleotide-binding universal stress UspA family protein